MATSRRYATTSTVLLDGAGGAVVIDPAWDPDELAAIPSDLGALGVRCLAGVATHEHYDHVMWHPGLVTSGAGAPQEPWPTWPSSAMPCSRRSPNTSRLT
ncbi:MAG: MBL fold metallo-hydrolase [Actinomycetota bacterium]|nr:MBL fold metallo-hydrolase [Actinomycetota bacterium]